MIKAWNRFFYEPCDPTPIALYRILFGALVLIKNLMLWPQLLLWYGEKGVLPAATLRLVQPGIRINLLNLLPQNDETLKLFFILFTITCVCLMIGLFTRASCILVFLGLVTLHHRNIFILTSGETVLRVTGFFLMFSACGRALSVDRLWRLKRGKESGAPPLCAPWAQRLIQIQISVVYISTLWWKLKGITWIGGTAVGIAHQVLVFQRFPVPYLFDHLWTVHLITWGTLLLEFSLGVLIWFKPLRYYILAAGVLFHLGLEYSMTIPLFEWIMIATYVCFIEIPPGSRHIFSELRQAYQVKQQHP